MAKERRLLVISPHKAVWLPIVRGFKKTGWVVEAATNLAAGMRLFDANPMAYDLVVMDEDHGCENATSQHVLSGLLEIRCLNERCKVFLLIDSRERSKDEIKELRECTHAILNKKDSLVEVFSRSARYFRYKVQ